MARFTPANVPATPGELQDFLAKEFLKIAQAMDTADKFLNLDTLYAAPVKFRDGMICRADGTQWNPGSGSGFYGYRDGAWYLLG